MRLRAPIMYAAASVALAGLGLAGPAAASAAAAPTSGSAYLHALASAHQGTTASPDISNFYIFPEINEGGTPHYGVCDAGQEYDAADPVKSAVNNCEYPIWLQQVKDGVTGWSYCIDPHSTRNNIGSKYWNPATIYVGKTTGAC
jgi:hypothetical protein